MTITENSTALTIPTGGFLDEIDALPADLAGAGHLEPPRMVFLHGVNAGGAKTPGAFYIKATELIDVPPAPWKPDNRFEDRDGELGFSAEQLNIAFLANRSQWYLPSEDRSKPIQWLSQYESGAKRMEEWLVKVEGIEDAIVLSLGSMNKAKPVADIVSTYRRGLLTQTMRRLKRTLPLYAFWLPIACKRDGNGKPLYLKATDGQGTEYGSVVTPPALAAQPIPRSAGELIADAELYQEYQASGWMAFKRTPRGTIDATYTISENPPALPAGGQHRNIPQSIDATDYVDASLPF